MLQRMCFSPDSRLLAIGKRDGWVEICDASTGRQLKRVGPHPGWVSAIAFSPDGQLLATGSDKETVHVWSLATGAQAFVFPDQHECNCSNALVWA